MSEQITADEVSVQDILTNLSIFWKAGKCESVSSWDKPMGAATLHPITALNLIKQYPFRYSYIQPCRRPADRVDSTHLARHHQFQVISRPTFGDIQEMFKHSMGRLIDGHVLEFVPDNWENPAIGASGTGFEVLMDGVEIAQLTTFHKIGRQKCEPASEIAYGLERIAQVLADRHHIHKICWSYTSTYGSVFEPQQEVDVRLFNRDASNIRQMRQELDNRLKHQNARGLAYYENILDVSHLINLLDARGALAPEAKTYYIRACCDLMEALVLNKFPPVVEQPYHQIYHPLIGLTQDHDERVKILAACFPEDAEAIMRLVSLWGVGEGVKIGNDPYKLKATAKTLGHMNMSAFAHAVSAAKKLMASNKNFSPSFVDALEHFVIKTNTGGKP